MIGATDGNVCYVGIEINGNVEVHLDTANTVTQSDIDGSRLSSGIYFAVLQSGGKELMKKMLLVK